jgi:CRP/FNR family transcriptional regulator, anaerobic regulatory protein
MNGGALMLTEKDLNYIKKSFTFWDNLNTKEKELLESNTTKVTYHKGYNLHNADSECLGVLLILSGELRIYILSEDGKEVTLYRLTDGDTCVLSASCILNSITFDVHIDAESETEVYLTNINAFSNLSKGNVYVENFAYKNTVERFSDVMWAIEQILFLSMDKRLAIFLFDEINKNNTDIITLTHEQIAKYIGSAREVVSRMLKVFQSQGILTLSRGQIHITDKSGLKKLIQ